MGYDRHPEKQQLGTLEPAVGRYLVARADERMRVPAQAAGIELAILGATPVPVKEEIVEIDGTPWLLADPFDDPMTEHTGGRLVIPDEPRERLISLVRAGVDPDALHIAHELPPGTRMQDIARLPKPADPARVAADVRLARRLRQAVSVAAVGVGAMAAGAAVAAPFTLIGAAAALDPVLFGGVLSRDGEHVAWVELARWPA